MERLSKQRKLNARRRQLPHVSAAALEAILKSCRDEGVPEGSLSRNEFRAARDMENNEATPYGPIASSMQVVGKDGNQMSIAIANPFALLWKAVVVCDAFSVFLQERLRLKPPAREDPWSIVIYTDGVTPGDPLSPINRRKFQACYWSLLELGTSALSREEAWFTVMTEFETVVADVSAGLSQLFAAIVKTFFNPHGYNFETAGILLPFGDSEVRLFCKLKMMLQDGGAHKQVWHARGDAATRLCFLCKNLVTESSGLAEQDATNQLKANIIKSAELVPSTGRDVRAAARYLASRCSTMSAAAFLEQQQSLGLTHHPHGILLDRELDQTFDPVEVYHHDWMHCFFVDGIFNSAVYLLLEAFIRSDKSNVYEVCGDYISKFVWPKWIHGAHLHDIFSTTRRDKHRAAKHIKAQASDMLSLVPVLALFTQTVLLNLDDNCHNECMAFLSLVQVIELIKTVFRVAVQPARMLATVENCLALCSAAFGFDLLTPKWHWMLHFHTQLEHTGTMLNCFCLERKHRAPKRYCTELKNISKHASRSLLNEVTAHHLGQLSKTDVFSFDVGLVDGKKVSARAKRELVATMALDGDIEQLEVKTALNSRYSALAACAKNDVVLVKEGNSFRAGKVRYHVSVNDEPFSLISLFTLQKHVRAASYAVWKASDDGATTLPTSAILDSVVYSKWADDVFCTLLPMEYNCSVGHSPSRTIF